MEPKTSTEKLADLVCELSITLEREFAQMQGPGSPIVWAKRARAVAATALALSDALEREIALHRWS